ncbi:MAG TPA: 2-methylcitrate dehydratase [Candidatus Rokubacteria bacterium]|nr:2-methylcitrate dehydratase [Candidatus Rokubacteria bacterium]
MDYLTRLARFVHETRLGDLPASTVKASRLVLLDTIGAIVAGSALPENTRLAHRAARRAPHGGASLLGHGLKADSLLATFTNATAGVALEMDEGNRLGGGHPAIHVIPAALAVAEEMGADGRRLLESIVAGYEVGSRLGGATQARPNVHAHGTWGTISTAAAVARLHDLPGDEIRHIINLSASMSPANTWTPALEGATIRNAYPGRSGLEGILAVDLHRAGFTALDDAPSDVYGTILADHFEPAQAVEGLGESYRIEENYFKLHACCRINHPALDAIMALRAEAKITAEQVARVRITSIPFGLRMTEPAPRSMLGAKFSIPYAAAAALVLGRTDAAAFADGVLADARIRATAARVEVAADPEMALKRADYPTAEVRITLTDGRVLTRTTGVVRGDAANPVAPDEIVAKFLALAGGPLGEARAREIVEVIEGVDGLKDIRELTALLTPPQA